MKKYRYKRTYKKNSSSLLSILFIALSFNFLKNNIETSYFPENFKATLSGLLILLIVVVILMTATSFTMKRKKKMKYLNSGIDIVDKMDGFEFEHFLKYHFEKQGYKASVTSGSYDFGADLLLEINNQKIVVQAKRYNSNVGIKAIQEVVASIQHYKAVKGIVVSNSYFTNSAVELASSNQIELWDRNKLIEIMSQNSGRTIANVIIEETISEGSCPSCKGKLVLRDGNNGQFYGCSNFPKCRMTKSV